MTSIGPTWAKMGPTQPNVEPYILQYIPKAPNIGPKRGLPLHSTTLNYATLHHITLHYTALPSTTLHYIVTLHYTTLQLRNYTHYTPLYSTTRRRQTVPHALQTNSAKYGPNVVENWICIRSMPSGQSYINSLRCSSTFRHQKLGLHTLHAPHELEIKQA